MVKGRGREIPPLVIVTWTQGAAWPAVGASSLLVIGMGGLLAGAGAACLLLAHP